MAMNRIPTGDQPTTEKITININAVDLGYIDYLVSEGHYATRTEFIKTAIKSQLNKHEFERKQLQKRTEQSDDEWVVGVMRMDAKELNIAAQSKEKKRLLCIGMLQIAPDVTLEQVEGVYESIRVYGVCKAPQAIKDAYQI